LTFRYAVQFCIAGDLRFLSHRDTLRLFERVAVRGGLPLRYSEGFNPRPRLSLPWPRTVGMASLDEWLCLQLTERMDPAEICARLADALPADLELRGCWPVEDAGAWRVREVLYEVRLEASAADDLRSRLQQILAAAPATVLRDTGPGKRPKVVDVRGIMLKIGVQGERLQMRLKVEQGRTIRPSEVLTLLDLPADRYAGRLVRRAVTWDRPALLDGYVCAQRAGPLEEG